MKKALLLLLLTVISFGAFAQAPSKKCPTCGQFMAKCQYKGKHSKNTTTLKPRRGTVNGHEWVGLSLSVKWATCNVGASSPSDYGGYYAWGVTSTKSRYDWDNCFDCINPKDIHNDSSWSKYKKVVKQVLQPNSGHDTAHENRGGTWHVPTKTEPQVMDLVVYNNL